MNKKSDHNQKQMEAQNLVALSHASDVSALNQSDMRRALQFLGVVQMELLSQQNKNE